LPAQRTKFSKRQFSQRQLLAVLCLMRYEDWAFREAEVRLGDATTLVNQKIFPWTYALH
jgi:hypothetical protein